MAQNVGEVLPGPGQLLGRVCGHRRDPPDHLVHGAVLQLLGVQLELYGLLLGLPAEPGHCDGQAGEDGRGVARRADPARCAELRCPPWRVAEASSGGDRRYAEVGECGDRPSRPGQEEREGAAHHGRVDFLVRGEGLQVLGGHARSQERDVPAVGAEPFDAHAGRD